MFSAMLHSQGYEDNLNICFWLSVSICTLCLIKKPTLPVQLITEASICAG